MPLDLSTMGRRGKLALVSLVDKDSIFHHWLVGRFEEWKKISKLFEDIAQSQIEKSGSPKVPWRNKIRLTMDGKSLGWNNRDNYSLMVKHNPEEGAPEEPIFTVLNANINDQQQLPNLSSLPTDFPIYLVAGRNPQRDPVINNQIQGVFVDEKGKLRPESIESKVKQVTRFSIRLARQSGPWRKYNQQPFETIQWGDLVNIYCHSSGIGPYANIERPPRAAIPICYGETEQCLGLPYLSHYSEDQRQVLRGYDEGTLSAKDISAFEVKGKLDYYDKIGKIQPPRDKKTSTYPAVGILSRHRHGLNRWGWYLQATLRQS